MREIVFRGKNVFTNEWYYGYLMNKPKHGLCIEFVDENDVQTNVVVDPNTIGQYTGMIDKNGQRIFEDDIVMKRTYNGKKPMRVVFSFGCFHCGFGGGSSTATHPYTLDDKQIEVIGNIHDNPDLLQQKENHA